MKKLRAVSTGGGLVATICKTTVLFVVMGGLGSAFWFASIPLAQAKQITPAEMIQSKLPANKTMASATDAQVLEAVCAAIKQWPKDTGLIVRTAAGSRQSLKADVLCMAVRCGYEKRALDCGWVVALVRDWTKAEPSEANKLSELALKCAPDCRDALQGDVPAEGPSNQAGPGNINPGPGSVGGGNSGNLCLVCHNGQQVQVACSDLGTYLSNHPGDTAGNCEATPNSNQ